MSDADQQLSESQDARDCPTVPISVPYSSSPENQAVLASDWQIGQRILDLYEVKEILSHGGMSVVYRVRHVLSNTDYAVRSPRASAFASPGYRKRFTHAIAAWIGLGRYPHLVCCYFVQTHGGLPQVFTEYVPGGTLHQWIQERRLYDGEPAAVQARLLDVALQMAWGLLYVHTHGEGLIHQDIKPHNVLMTPDGVAKITDLELARTPGHLAEVFLTPAYASPELFAEAADSPVSHKTDLWSWAVTVLEMYLGGLPWDPRIAVPGYLPIGHWLEGYLQGGALNPQIPRLPRALQELLRECLKPTPTERPEDFAAVAERLQEIYQEAVGRDYPRVLPAPGVIHQA